MKYKITISFPRSRQKTIEVKLNIVVPNNFPEESTRNRPNKIDQTR